MKYIEDSLMMSIPATEIYPDAQVASPLVSVLMLAYNHGEYIRQAVNSIVDQQTEGFTFELLIGEDNSKDNTLAICKELQQQHPHIIRLVVSETNVGMHPNFARLWVRARGKYIAFCEGDDYWVDYQKLAKQVDFLNAHPECTLCGTYTQSIRQNVEGNWENAELIRPPKLQEFYSFEEMIPSYNFHFSSVMVCKGAVEFPNWFWEVYCVDRPFYLLATQQGLAGLIPKVTSVYRHHRGGVWSPLSLENKADRSAYLFQKLKTYFDEKYKKIFDTTLGDILWFYMSEALKINQINLAKKLFSQSVMLMRLNLQGHSFFNLIKAFLKLYIIGI